MDSNLDHVLLSTAYFPPIEYFYILIKSSEVSIEIHDTYKKQTYRNRCNIYSPNGKQTLSIPVTKIEGNRTKTKDIIISKYSNWKINHWRSLETAYNSSAFFLYYKDDIKDLIMQNVDELVEFNYTILQYLTTVLGIKSDIKLSESYLKPTNVLIDLREQFNSKLNTNHLSHQKYFQVFNNKYGFIPNLSILDLIFNEGPNSHNYLSSLIHF
ncbi:MAG: WbqC family protein [Bacteroidetes bacterium]|nr:WbqC family protein [Bacteroidota bacterium]